MMMLEFRFRANATNNPLRAASRRADHRQPWLRMTRRVARAFSAFAVLALGAILIGIVALAYRRFGPFPVGADEVHRISANDVRQGVSVGRAGVYAIADQSIARLNLSNGYVVARWRGSSRPFDHLNSCIVRGERLICAASNYPRSPMRSGILWFDTIDLKLLGIRDLTTDYGSLTWLDRHAGNWWACYANYDGRGEAPRRDHRATIIVRYDGGFAEKARYRLPESVLARLAPRSASGGSWGRDGLLYLTGHDRAELYALALPLSGNVLRHVATLPTHTHGQAIAWDPSASRLLWSIERPKHLIIASHIPPVVVRN